MSTDTALSDAPLLEPIALRRPAYGPMARARRIAGRVVVYLLLIAGGFMALLPLIWMVSTSLKPNGEVFTLPPVWLPEHPTLEFYAEALTGSTPSFLTFGINTVILEFLIVTGTVLTSSMAAYAFSRVRWRGRDVVFGAVLATMMLPTAATLVPVFIGWSQLGAIDTFVPLAVPAWFGGGAFNIFLLRQFMMTIPRDFDEAAMLDGASHWYTATRIIMPMITPALLVVTIFTFIGVWNDFFGPLIYLNSNDNYTIALGLTMFKQLHGTSWNLLMAATVATIIPIIVVLLVFQKKIIDGSNITPGLKG